MKYTPRSPTDNHNVSTVHPLKELAILLFGSAVVILCAYGFIGLFIDYVAVNLPFKAEATLSNAMAGRFNTAEKHLELRDRLQTIINKLGARIPGESVSYKVEVQDDKAVNAFAVPGNMIVVTSGLTERVKSENGIAMVLGHELGHFANRDHLRRFGRGIVAFGLASFIFGTESSVAQYVSNLLGTATLSFTREQEMDADMHGLDLLVSVYGHAGGASEFYKQVAEEQGSSFMEDYFSTHPAPNTRIKVIENKIHEKGFAVRSVNSF